MTYFSFSWWGFITVLLDPFFRFSSDYYFMTGATALFLLRTSVKGNFGATFIEKINFFLFYGHRLMK